MFRYAVAFYVHEVPPLRQQVNRLQIHHRLMLAELIWTKFANDLSRTFANFVSLVQLEANGEERGVEEQGWMLGLCYLRDLTA